MADVERLVLRMEANMRGYERALQKMQGDTNRTAGRVENRFRQKQRNIDRTFMNIQRNATRALGMIGVAVSGAALGRLVTDSLQAAESLNDLSLQVNANVEGLQTLRFAVDQNGGSADLLDRGLRRLAEGMGRVLAGETNEATRALDRLGLGDRIRSGEIQTTDELFRQLADAMRGLETQAERTAAASQLFGQRMGVQLSQSLSLGTAGLSEFEQHAREAGIVIEESLVRDGARANAVLREMRQRFGRQLESGILANSDAIVQLAESVGTLVTAFLNAIGAAHRLGLEIREIMNLDPDNATRSVGFQRAAGRVRSGEGMSVREFERILIDELGRQEASRAMETFGLRERTRGGGSQFTSAAGSFGSARFDEAVSGIETIAGRGRAAVADLLDGFSGAAGRAAELEADLADIVIPRILGGDDDDDGFTPRTIPGAERDSSQPVMVDKLAAAMKEADRQRIEDDANKALEMARFQEIAKDFAQTMAEESAREMDRAREDFARSFAHSFAGGVQAAFDGRLQDFLKQRLRDAMFNALTEAFANIGRRVFDQIIGAAMGGGGIPFGGKRMSGGGVSPGKAYTVGERGAETFVPGMRGSILPNPQSLQGRSSGGGGTLRIMLHVGEGPEFATRVAQITGPMVSDGMQVAVQTSRAEIGADMANSQSRRLR